QEANPYMALACEEKNYSNRPEFIKSKTSFYITIAQGAGWPDTITAPAIMEGCSLDIFRSRFRQAYWNEHPEKEIWIAG
ncbi:MAG: hypothetical protein C0403_17950, partial [Desulfobacterium sp.]|nr:hypothetical protein [Desulfobacterium sp.]